MPSRSRAGDHDPVLSTSFSHRFALTVTAVVAAVGAVDAAIGATWDLFAVFSLILVLVAVVLLGIRSDRTAVPLRSDLVAWLRRRVALTGEPVEVIADRCIAACRADLDRS